MNKIILFVVDVLITVCAVVGIWLLFKEDYLTFTMLQVLQVNLKLTKMELKNDNA